MTSKLFLFLQKQKPFEDRASLLHQVGFQALLVFLYKEVGIHGLVCNGLPDQITILKVTCKTGFKPVRILLICTQI